MWPTAMCCKLQRRALLRLCPIVYARIAVEVMKAVNFFNYNNRQQELTDLCLCSGGCNIIPLRQALAETTHLHLHTAQELLATM